MTEKIRRVIYLPVKIDDRLLSYQHKQVRLNKKHYSLTEIITSFIDKGLREAKNEKNK